MHAYNLAWGLHRHSRFVDLDFVSRPQVCQKFKLQIACFWFLSSSLKHCVVATYIKKIMHDMICVTLVSIEGRWLTFFFGWSSFWACWKRKHLDLLRHHKCDKCQTLYYGTTYWALPVNTTFNDLDNILRSQQCRTVFIENFVFLFIGCWVSEVASEYTTVFHFCTHSGEIIDMFSDWTKTLMLAFWGTLFMGGLSNFACLWHSSWSSDSCQFWWPWPYFKVTGISES